MHIRNMLLYQFKIIKRIDYLESLCHCFFKHCYIIFYFLLENMLLVLICYYVKL